MLKINKIEFVINTTGGLYGSKYSFADGLNIVRADNTSGKSSLFQAITYCLGFEEIIGGRNEKTMQSVFRDQVEYPKDVFHSVIQSFVYLEFENGNNDIVTVKRSVVSGDDRKPQLIDVFFGEIIDKPEHTLDSQPMYIHDKGGASEDIYGFHYFLEAFLGWELPTVLTVTGDERKLYLQQIASAFLIEQKSGWSDFFATMPHYSLASKEARTVEFLLSLDVTDNKKRKQHISYEKRLLEEKWELLNKQVVTFVQKGGGRLLGLTPKPTILNDHSSFKVLFSKEEEEISISDFISSQVELNVLQGRNIKQVGDNVSENEIQLEKYNNYVDKLALNYEMLGTELNFDREKLRSYNAQLDFLKEDLRKNKGAFKVQKLGSEFELKTASQICPTCSQGISDSLLPLNVEQTPMRLEDNIEFIEAQMKMIRVYIEGQEKAIGIKKESWQTLEKSYRLHARQFAKLKESW